MSTYDLEEQEQLAALKAWWKEHGGGVALAAILVAGAVAAWSGWVWYQRSQAAQAAALYDTLQKAARANDLKATQDTAGANLWEHPPHARRPTRAPGSGAIPIPARPPRDVRGPRPS